MSKAADLLQEYIDRLDTIAAGEPVVEQADDREYLNGLLDQLEDALNNAVDIASQLGRSSELRGVINAYTRPWLEAWASDRNQMGSVPNLRSRLEEDDEDYED
jgi:hypothetical protein